MLVPVDVDVGEHGVLVPVDSGEHSVPVDAGEHSHLGIVAVYSQGGHSPVVEVDLFDLLEQAAEDAVEGYEEIEL